MSLVPAVIGLVVGTVVGLTSTGGGALLTPALILFLGVPPGLAVGTDVLIASGMKLVGSGLYSRRGHVHVPTVLRLAAGSLPGAGLGLLLLRSVPAQSLDGFFRGALGIALLLAGSATLFRLRRTEAPLARATPKTPVTVALGFATGVLVSVTSIGSGSLLLCVLALFFPSRRRRWSAPTWPMLFSFPRRRLSGTWPRAGSISSWPAESCWGRSPGSGWAPDLRPPCRSERYASALRPCSWSPA